ncbi:amidase [Haloarcula nitratireducens]|uniref:Amidase n=1 Tax=Haloarcula nitratireducens TaxID=2487749 RepID=A0AAW4PHJ3_9EURY|nr:amidase [Halomicroarcula nitratireducens]MBX0297217.1 amidase [Halomicroarcula nitratireducens]
MTFELPPADDLREIANQLALDISTADMEYYRTVVEESLDELEQVHELESPSLPPTQRQFGTDRSSYQPDKSENPHNAWITRCDVAADVSGPLDGTTIGLKDSIALAGVEMTCGSSLLEGYTPEIDATVVSRLLAAGARITGKCNMENFAFSASSETSDFGAVTNPAAPMRIAGGSSSGSAAAVAGEEVDVALGCDQGASIRVPAACCGIIGLDPTTGLVPYTGIFPMDPTIDSVGPMARTVREVAEVLDVIAGVDGLDPRQGPAVQTSDYTATLDDNVGDLEIGVLNEGFEGDATDDRVVEAVQDAVDTYERLGAETTAVSVPLHHDAVSIGFTIWAYGALQAFTNGGQGVHHDGWYDTDLMTAFAERRSTCADGLSEEGKATLIAMQHLADRHGGATYGRAQNLRFRLKREFDELLSTVDVLALPTMPILPFERRDDIPEVERTRRTITLCRNTATSSLTKHPSISIPYGSIDGVPVGVLLIADHYDEQTLLKTAAALQETATETPQL